MIVDYHTHTLLCKHAEGELQEYIQRAIELGLDEIGCSEHSPMPHGFDNRHRMSLAQYQSIYAPAVTEASERYKDQITVRRGLEADFFPGTEEWVKSFIAENDFDYVIGSVHFLGKVGAEKPLFHQEYTSQQLEDLHIEYFEAIRASAESRLFDIIGHCDLVKKHETLSSPAIDGAIWDALKAIKQNDLCIEINTSGLRKAEAEMYPSEKLLSMIRELAIPLTLGSDAHRPQDVGRSFAEASAFIEKYGDGTISIFKRRERTQVPLRRLRMAPSKVVNQQ